ncbi:E3 ubiquitin-protein ligase RNF146 isoform X3 [Sus scrofa]|uniref:E3 ubiquitin-protein ligase RNF146 isoform X3 n=1 Tax=Sus scrofa TaxID=9823 RepID=UPI000A2AFFB1|nr:E3 ubiquitin-protein ligase RNF146 isoform X3 [Sus scrofa]
MLLPRPQISPVVLRPFRVLQHLTTRKAKYKAVKKIQAAKLQGPEGSIREERTLRKASGLALGEISRGGAGASSPVRGAASASRGPAPRDATSGHVTAARVPGRCGIRGRRERTARRPAVAREVPRWTPSPAMCVLIKQDVKDDPAMEEKILQTDWLLVNMMVYFCDRHLWDL